MANIQQEISSFLPEATFVEGTILEVSVPDAKWHDLALYLHNQLHFDYLVSIVGMDWGETLGCVYYLTSTVDNSQVSVKIEAADRENPLLHSVSVFWNPFHQPPRYAPAVFAKRLGGVSFPKRL